MEVGNNLHRDDEVTAKGNEHVNTDPITKKKIPIRDSTTFAPTERSLKTPAVGNNNRANLIRDDSVIKAIVTTCRLYYKPDTQTTIDSVRQILTDAHKSMKITEQNESQIYAEIGLVGISIWKNMHRMKPFISVLYAEYAGKNDHASFRLSVKASQVIRYFRVLLGLIAVNDIEFIRLLYYQQ
jgi:hypothetical protein